MDSSPAEPSLQGPPDATTRVPNNFTGQQALSRGTRKLILCFDGTGNKFNGDESDSNILKIFRMLDREADDQYHYYQPGIGTYVVSGSLSHTSVRARLNSWYQKGKDSAVGSSFDQHVVGGYRFLMRFYNPGDEIYMFGFSRGAYIARFLAEMLDNIGLLSHGNEEMVKFAWKAFAQWQCRSGVDGEGEQADEDRRKQREMHRFMKGFRETFSRPVGRIQFLGLFDTVNSVPRFETAWMQRSKFPYTARSSARYIRHAVSIDERRAKFRQDLMYQGGRKHVHRHHHHSLHHHLSDFFDPEHRPEGIELAESNEEKISTGLGQPPQENLQSHAEERGRRPSTFLSPSDARNGASRSKAGVKQPEFAPYRSRSKSRRRAQQLRRLSQQNMQAHQGGRLSCDTTSNLSGIEGSDLDAESDENEQDIDEVWFAGTHGDVGGGWEALADRKSTSHVPLTWMVREAMKAGLPFDLDKVAEMGCGEYVSWNEREGGVMGKKPDIPAIRVQSGGSAPTSPLDKTDVHQFDEESGRSDFHNMLYKAHTSRIHDSLAFGGGLNAMAVAAWKFMEWLPFRRMDLRPDGSWVPIRWPLPRGEVRDIPDDVRVHGSVVRRMQADETYRPGNLIIGGGGRGVRRAPPEYGIGEWVCVAEHGDPIGEIWVRKPKDKDVKEAQKKVGP